ncbi:hypothetical protein CI109_100278 [Kwoniella shandongensis]|uniref:Uncharacterized protein n=1 Tax=Kwoniella shandongensis TaxID=1734106 RepID=A0A5M6C447_9TREE|nr:uncharacterized protein CI109_001877 [Kwoniella shandongensis]KAA5529937.1 hypothetical protein CI109_001877 [Kwoniella shandongensis]
MDYPSVRHSSTYPIGEMSSTGGGSDTTYVPTHTDTLPSTHAENLHIVGHDRSATSATLPYSAEGGTYPSASAVDHQDSSSATDSLSMHKGDSPRHDVKVSVHPWTERNPNLRLEGPLPKFDCTDWPKYVSTHDPPHSFANKEVSAALPPVSDDQQSSTWHRRKPKLKFEEPLPKFQFPQGSSDTSEIGHGHASPQGSIPEATYASKQNLLTRIPINVIRSFETQSPGHVDSQAMDMIEYVQGIQEAAHRDQKSEEILTRVDQRLKMEGLAVLRSAPYPDAAAVSASISAADDSGLGHLTRMEELPGGEEHRDRGRDGV